MPGKGVSGHHRPFHGITHEWDTPPEILEAIGPFDDDPADGSMLSLMRPWRGFVFLNPPYGHHVGEWLKRLADHGQGIALTFARTETSWFFSEVWERADALLFLRGRLHFHRNGERAKHNAGGPSVLIAYGGEATLRLSLTPLDGHFVGLH